MTNNRKDMFINTYLIMDIIKPIWRRIISVDQQHINRLHKNILYPFTIAHLFCLNYIII